LRTDLKRPHCTYSENAQNLQRKSKIFSNQFIEKAGEGVLPFGDFWERGRMTTPSGMKLPNCSGLGAEATISASTPFQHWVDSAYDACQFFDDSNRAEPFPKYPAQAFS